MNSLKRQARQARRYKEISGDIRKSEALQHHLRWKAACEQVDTEETTLEEAVRTVARLTQDEAQAIREHTEAADALQPLRDHEATRAAVLHRLTVEREALDEEEQRAVDRKQELEDRLTQLESDLERERDREQEAKETLEQLAAEQQGLADAPDASDAAQAARGEMDAHARELEEAESGLTDLTSRVERLRAEREQLTAALRSSEERIERLRARDEDEKARLEELERTGNATSETIALRDTVGVLSQQAETREQDALSAEEVLANARERETEIRDRAKAERIRAQELETEAQTLAKLLKPAEDVQWTPVLGETRVEPGYELALGAALGDDLDASDDVQAPAHWSLLGSGDADPVLPDGAQPLSRFVKAPRSLARRLAQIGVVDAAEGATLQSDLKPGQRLVSRSGDLWRWDGYAAAADAPTPAAKRLSERNRLDSLSVEVEDARQRAETAEQDLAAISAEVAEAETADAEATRAWRTVQAELGTARDALAAAEQDAQASNKELAALTEARARTEEALEETEATIGSTRQSLDALASDTALAEERETQSALVAEKRSAHAEARARFDSIEREQQIRSDRLESISFELEKWTERQESASQQIETLKDRHEESRSEIEAFGDLPAQVADRRSRLLDEIARAETERNDAADALANADTLLRDREKTMRDAQTSLSETREERARVEARLEAARERRAEQARMIADQLDCAPDECLAIAELEPDAELPALDELDARVSRLKADRERLGGVNLAAEEEVGEIEQQLGEMDTEQADLEEAIARLRQGIAKLNREGRKRLLDAFDEVNDHFQRLFKTLFGGGEAELQLVESDDPLNSGLEILARPPGKKPQVLTLLSGGEKALTAMALIFAVFLTNPSPICVLDEVDAPLDDTNVERFCKMMEEMSKSTDTRFLIITHHPMTMARVDRLFGVTMAERGVSQLVSVDLETAEQYRETG